MTIDHTNKILSTIRSINETPSTTSQSIPITNSTTHKLDPDYIQEYSNGTHGLVPSTTVSTGKVLCSDGWNNLNTTNRELFIPKDGTTKVINTEISNVPSYIVGSNQLEVYFNGQKQKEGSTYGTYQEVGSSGSSSTSIRLLTNVYNADILCRVTSLVNPDNIVGFTVRGTFTSGTTYYYGDIVTYNNCTYICKISQYTPLVNTTVMPNNDTSNWTKLFDNIVTIGYETYDLGTITTSTLTIDSNNGTSQKFTPTNSTLSITLPSNASINDTYILYILRPNLTAITFSDTIVWSGSTVPTFTGAMSVVKLTKTSSVQWSGSSTNINSDDTGYVINYYS